MIYCIGKVSDEYPSTVLEEVIPLIRGHPLIFEDVETVGLDYFIDNPIRTVQLGTLDNQFVFEPNKENIVFLKEILEDKLVTKIVVNGIFERNMLRSLGIKITSMFDLSLAFQVYRQGRLAHNVVTEYGSYYIYSLAGMYKELLGKDIDKSEQKSFIGQRGLLTKGQVIYGADDVKLNDLYEEIVRKLVKVNLLHEDYTLYKTVHELIKEDKYSVTVLEMKVQEVYADMLYNGIYINPDKWLALYKENKRKSPLIERELNEYVISKFNRYKLYYKEPIVEIKCKQTNLFGEPTAIQPNKKGKRRINWNSPKQVKEIFELELGSIPKDKKGKETTDIKVLAKLPKNYLIDKFIKFRKLSKLISSYGEEYLKKNVHPKTGRVHFQISQILETGRIAPKKPNMAQIPSTKEWRNCFTGNMVGADYKGQESQTMADKSNDRAFIDFYQNGGGDGHSMVASRVFSAKEGFDVHVSKFQLKAPSIDFIKKYYPKCKDIVKDGNMYIGVGKYEYEKDEDGIACPLRTSGKVLNFFISFGGSAYTLSKDQNLTIREAEELINSFWKGFPQLKEYFDKEKKFAIEHGYSIINKITKRIRWYPEWKKYRSYEIKKKTRMNEIIAEGGTERDYWNELKDRSSELSYWNRVSYKIKGDIERQAMNSGIQGLAADMTKTAVILLGERLNEHILIVNVIHDEILLEITDRRYEMKAAELLQWCMEEASRIFLNTLVIEAKPYIANEWRH